MSRVRDLSIGMKLYAGFGVIILLLAVTGGVALWGSSSQVKATETVIDLEKVSEAMGQARYDIADMNGWQTAYAFDIQRNRAAGRHVVISALDVAPRIPGGGRARQARPGAARRNRDGGAGGRSCGCGPPRRRRVHPGRRADHGPVHPQHHPVERGGHRAGAVPGDRDLQPDRGRRRTHPHRSGRGFHNGKLQSRRRRRASPPSW